MLSLVLTLLKVLFIFYDKTVTSNMNMHRTTYMCSLLYKDSNNSYICLVSFFLAGL